MGTLRRLATGFEVDILELLQTPHITRAIKPLVTAYKDSPWAAIDKPTEDELHEILQSRDVIEFAKTPDTAPNVIHRLIQAIRAGKLDKNF